MHFVVHFGAVLWRRVTGGFMYPKLESLIWQSTSKDSEDGVCFPFVFMHVLVICHYRKCQPGVRRSCRSRLGSSMQCVGGPMQRVFLIAQCSLVRFPGPQFLRHVLLSNWKLVGMGGGFTFCPARILLFLPSLGHLCTYFKYLSPYTLESSWKNNLKNKIFFKTL